MGPDIPVPGTGDPQEIQRFLADFAQKYNDFQQVYQRYLNGEINVDEITRELSAATAEPEMKFAEYSFQMSIEQLQHFGLLQKHFDDMMVSIFEVEIKHNREVCANAIENGEYFLVGLTYRGMESSIHMMYVKDRIKSDENQKLTELQQEKQSVENMLKVIKALENVLQGNLQTYELTKIQKALKLYYDYFHEMPRTIVRTACDKRVIKLIQEHFEKVRTTGLSQAVIDNHIAACARVLRVLANIDELKSLLQTQ